MRICGFNKTTLLDYPGKVASTIFLGGCNFRCPFCQNGILVVAPGEQPNYSQEELLTFLKKRKGILDGVCISGGEPTLSDGLEEFLGKIKELGYAVKLDTNGSRPKIVKHLAESGLLPRLPVWKTLCNLSYGVQIYTIALLCRRGCHDYFLYSRYDFLPFFPDNRYLHYYAALRHIRMVPLNFFQLHNTVHDCLKRNR